MGIEIAFEVKSSTKIDVKDYAGPLGLYCFDCDRDVMTTVKVDPATVAVKGDETDETLFHFTFTGTRNCCECKGKNVGFKMLRGILTIDSKGLNLNPEDAA